MQEPNRQQRVGREGEEQAARYLQQQGCTVVARNFRTRRGEIDLIVRDQGVLVTHDLDTLAQMATSVAVLAERRIVSYASLADTLAYDHPFVARF